MIRWLLLLMFCSPGVCFASHWCIMQPVKADGPLYPPIAKAAHVQGVVISRLEFGADGSVSKVEIVNGPPMLTETVEKSEAHWVFRMDGNDTATSGCQILVISEFSIAGSEETNEDRTPWPITPRGIYRQRIRSLHALIMP